MLGSCSLNTHKTNDLIVESSRRRLVSSSTSASSLVDDRQFCGSQGQSRAHCCLAPNSRPSPNAREFPACPSSCHRPRCRSPLPPGRYSSQRDRQGSPAARQVLSRGRPLGRAIGGSRAASCSTRHSPGCSRGRTSDCTWTRSRPRRHRCRSGRPSPRSSCQCTWIALTAERDRDDMPFDASA